MLQAARLHAIRRIEENPSVTRRDDDLHKVQQAQSYDGSIPHVIITVTHCSHMAPVYQNVGRGGCVILSSPLNTPNYGTYPRTIEASSTSHSRTLLQNIASPSRLCLITRGWFLQLIDARCEGHPKLKILHTRWYVVCMRVCSS